MWRKYRAESHHQDPEKRFIYTKQQSLSKEFVEGVIVTIQPTNKQTQITYLTAD
jgi:hypothetical protein